MITPRTLPLQRLTSAKASRALQYYVRGFLMRSGRVHGKEIDYSIAGIPPYPHWMRAHTDTYHYHA